MSEIAEKPGPGKRVGIYLKPYQFERMQEMIDSASAVSVREGHEALTQSRLLAAVVSVMSLDELKTLMERYRALEDLEAELHMRASREMVRMVAGKAPSTILKMRDAVREQSAPAPGVGT